MVSTLPSAPVPSHAWGYGLATIAGDGTVLDTWFPAPSLDRLPAGRHDPAVPAGRQPVQARGREPGVEYRAVAGDRGQAIPPCVGRDGGRGKRGDHSSRLVGCFLPLSARSPRCLTSPRRPS